MSSMQLESAEDQLQVNLLEHAMYNWFAAWRALNDEFLRLQTKAMRFQQLIELAEKQIECYENILKERQFLNDKFFKCIANAGKKDFLFHKEYREKVDQIIMLKDQLCLAKNNLKIHKLQLERAREKLFSKAANFELVRKSLEESKAINKNLREYNLTLNALKRETMELYKSRDLMFVYQLIEKEQELINAQDKTKAVASAGSCLQTNIDQIQLQESVLRKQLAVGGVKRNDKNFKYHHIVLQYMRFLWDCVSSLAQCPKLEEPSNKLQFALVLF